MNKRTTTRIMTRFGFGTFFLVLLFLGIYVMPLALGQKIVNKNSLGGMDAKTSQLPTLPSGATSVPAPGTPGDSWVVRAPVPYNARGIFAASDGTFVYAGGGYDGTSNHADLLRFDPVANSWTSLASSPDQHYLSQAVYFNGKIYNMGGFGSSGPTNTTRIYTIGTNTWTTGAPMPAALSNCATALWNGMIYVAAGYNGSTAVNTLYAYNIAGNSWSTLAPLPQALFLPGFGAINGKLYIASGNNGTIELNTLYIYDIGTNDWTTGATVPQAVTGPGSTVFNGKLYLYGGGFPTTLSVTQIYDPGSNTWSSGPNMNVNRLWFYGTAVGGNSIVAPGGDQTPGTPINDNEQLIGGPCGLILNGGFETGSFAPGWVIDGNNARPVVYNNNSHSGTFSAFLGSAPAGFCGHGSEATGDSSFYQQFTVPAGGGTLSFWHWDCSTDIITFDWQDAYITNTSGTILQTIFHQCLNGLTWINQTVDMTPYAGQTVRIKFLVHEDGFGDLTGMLVDDVYFRGPPATDFNHDLKPDYLLYNGGTRQTAVWYMNNNVFAGGVFGPTLPAGWKVIDVADFDGNGNPDYALFNPGTHQTAIWYLSGVTFVSGAYGPTLPSSWALVATADFNGDCKPDYVLYNASTRQTAVWYMNNNVFAGSAYGPTLPTGWSIAGVADFNRDGRADYLLFNASTRQTAIWYLSGVTFMGSLYGPTLPGGWQLVGTADFNGDGKPDYLLYNPSTRQTAIWYMNNNVFAGSAYGPNLPAGWNVVAP